MPSNENYSGLFDNNISALFFNGLRQGGFAHAGQMARLWLGQYRQARVRRRNQDAGPVPPILIASLTGKCNLSCANCYSKVHHRQTGPEMTTDQWEGIFSQAEELGIAVIMLAGGEPLLRRDVIGLTRRHPDIVFPVFTNSFLIDESLMAVFRKQTNLIPVISLEGFEQDTDLRRGRGVFELIKDRMALLAKNGVFFGASITVRSDTFDDVTGAEFLKHMRDAGCRLFIFVEFVPLDDRSASLALTARQRKQLMSIERTPGKKAVCIVFPGDEEQYGGCLAAGRGFVHVNPWGGLEPCPFAPYSDTSLLRMPLKEALRSRFMASIRNNHDRLTETSGGCALWANREWVENLAAEAVSENTPPSKQ
jgi:MoaA/NifB/PqqE/SkfB family radical SAM enzyme